MLQRFVNIDATNNGCEKESSENSAATPETEPKRVKDQMATKELEGTEKKKISSKIPRVSTRKRIPHEKLRH